MVNDGMGNGKERPRIYESAPPEWVPPTSNAADLGFQGFFPQPLRRGQNESELSEQNVKTGLSLGESVQVETFTNKSRHIQELKNVSLVHELEDLMNQILRRRADDLPSIPQATFRIPPRVTLNDAKRNSWFSDLANPEVPLYKLGKSIPHGVRGNDLLDLLHSNNVAVPRAVWFIRVLGGNETAGLRNKPNYNPMQYSIEWANVITGYLKKQLLDIALPIAPRLGLNIKQTFKGILSDPDSRERWVSKFIYTLDLLRVFYSEVMIDHATFLMWLVQTFASCNLAQAGFIARLVDDYLPGISASRALLRPLMESCLSKCSEICNSSTKETLDYLQVRIKDIFCRAFLYNPTSLVSPRIWRTYEEMVKQVLVSIDMENFEEGSSAKQGMLNIRLEMRDMLLDIEKRNEAMLFKIGTQPATGCLRSSVLDVQLLNSITTMTDISSISFFDSGVESDQDYFSHKLGLLLSWSICPFQYGSHRPYAAMTLLHIWRDRMEDRASRRDCTSPDEVIQDALFDFLDINEYAGDAANLSAVSLLFGELVEKNLFSYDQYIQRIIARGESGLSFNEEPGSRHRMFLRVIPLYQSNPALVNQRKIALYGFRARKIPEDEIEANIKHEIKDLLPEIFKGESPADIPKSSISSSSVLRSAARYEQVRVLKQWFMPSIRKYIARIFPSSTESDYGCLRTYCVIIDILEAMRCFRSALDISLEVLKAAQTFDLLIAVISNIRLGLNLWVCMASVTSIVQVLLACHKSWKARGQYLRCIIELLLEADISKHLDDMTRQHILEDAHHFALALYPKHENPDPVPPILTDVILLVQDASADGPSTLAKTLWYKYCSSPEWVWITWDNAIASLQHTFSVLPGAIERRFSILRYGEFLLNVDRYTADGIDVYVNQWFHGPGQSSMQLLSPEVWDMATVLFLYLAVHGALKIATLLQCLVYPAWRLGSSIESPEQFAGLETFLRAVNNLCEKLLVYKSPGVEEGLPPLNLLELQKLKTRRKDVYRDASFPLLLQNVTDLVLIENNEHISNNFRGETAALRRSICRMVDFRLGSTRNLSIAVGAFAQPPNPKGMQENMHEPLVSALRLIFDDEECDDQTQINAFLSPWKLSASAAVTSFVLQRVGQRLDRESTKVQAKAELTRLVNQLLHNSISAEEADFVSEMAKGVSESVAGEFVNTGLERISKILDEIDDSEAALVDIPSKAGHFLSLLGTITQPFRNTPSALPPLKESIQDKLVTAILAKLSQIEGVFQKASEDDSDGRFAQSVLTEPMIFLARLIQFDLGFPEVWTPTFKDIRSNMLDVVLKLAILHGGGYIVDPIAFTLLLDTAFYIFDESPLDSRRSSDLFQHCSDLDPSSLPSIMPRQYSDLICGLLKYTPRDLPTAGLFYASRSSDGALQFGSPVQMRPWEWIESLGDPMPTDAKEKEKEQEEKEKLKTNYLVRNNTSIPLEAFDARFTGEGIRHLGAEGGPDRMEERMKSYFEEDIVSESMYEREWREGRLNDGLDHDNDSMKRDSGLGQEQGQKESSGRSKGTPSSGSHRSSPALSAHTTSGMRSSVGVGPPSASSSVRRTQSPTVSSRGDPMDVDSQIGGDNRSIEITIAGKRKASTAGIPLDEEPATASDEAAIPKKGRGRVTSGKTTGKTVTAKTTRKRK